MMGERSRLKVNTKVGVVRRETYLLIPDLRGSQDSSSRGQTCLETGRNNLTRRTLDLGDPTTVRARTAVPVL